MISEGSCDTEDWSNDAENTYHHSIYNFDHRRKYILKFIKIENCYFKLLYFFLYFWSNRYSLYEQKKLL